MNQATLIDLGACIGCDACSIACRVEHALPPGMSRIQLKILEHGTWPEARRSYDLVRCVDCADAPCATICPTGALSRGSDGTVALDAESCLGCRACLAACPYDALTIHPDTGVADRCDGCASRRDQGLEPACAVACPTGAIRLFDLEDPENPTSRALARGELRTRRAELGTRPRVHFRGEEAVDPLKARSAPLYATRERGDAYAPLLVTAGAPALLAAAPPPRQGLDVRTALMSWTQGVAAGVYLVPAAGAALGLLPSDLVVWRIVAPLIGLLYLAGSWAVVTWGSPHRDRLKLLFTRPNWSSWLARGVWVSFAMAGLLLLQLLGTLSGVSVQDTLLIPGVLLSVLLTMNTPMVMRQCRGRGLWIPARGVLRAVCAAVATGGAMLLPFVGVLCPEDTPFFQAATALGAVGWLSTVALDLALVMPTPEGRAAARELRGGAWRNMAWAGVLLTFFGVVASPLGTWVSLLVLAGPLLYFHAWLGAGQSVPQA